MTAPRAHLTVVVTSLAVLLLHASACCFGSPSAQMESSYRDRVSSLRQLQGRVGAEKRAEIQQRLAAFEQEHGALPADATQREAALGPLNQRMHAYIEQCEADATRHDQAARAAEQAALAPIRAQLDGSWSGGGMTLVIGAGGHVAYHRQQGATERSVEGAMSAFRRDGFDVEVLSISTSFRIDRLPHQDAGVWKMTVDGVELTRQ